MIGINVLSSNVIIGYDQTEYQDFGYNGEADLDLQYAMALVGPTQPVTLYQAGDDVEGESCSLPVYNLSAVL